MTTFNSVFISYRRDPGYASAKLIWRGLRDAGIDAFLDLESMNDAGDFDAKILNQIAGRPYFVIVLTHGTLDRCANQGDWLWRELEYAIAEGRILLPAMIPPFDIADVDRFLPSPHAAEVLKKSNGVTFPPDYFDAAEQRLIRRLQPVALAVREFSSGDHDFARRATDEVTREADDRTGESHRRRWLYLVAAVVAVLLGVVGAIVATSGGDSANLGDQLKAGEDLRPGQRLQSDTGHHVLEMTAEGRLRASTDGRTWWSPTDRAGIIARMQIDGNLVIYNKAPYTDVNAVWASRTEGNDDVVLVVDDAGGRGTVTIYAKDGRPLFSVEDQGS